MRKGSLAAHGTPLELKAEYGSALQFTLFVESQRVREAEKEIIRHFKDFQESTEVVAGEAGNITVKISKIRQTDEDEGVDVHVLTDFVAWLENKDVSGVTEYGFSNSSLEEVFLKVTQAEDEEQKERDALDEYDVCCAGCSKGFTLCCLRSCCRCCCFPTRREQEESHGEDEDAIAAVQEGVDTDKVASFKPVLSTWRQTLGILYFSFSRNWLGKWSSYIFHILLIGLALTLALRATNSSMPVPYLAGLTVLLSLTLITFVSPLYRDRNLGVFYLMRAQGLLKSSFLLGTGLYAFIIQALFGFILLTVVYGTGLYREPDICDLDGYPNCLNKSWGGKRNVQPDVVWYNPDGDEVVYATWQGGGYGQLLGAALAFALTMPGAVFSSSYIPGFKLALVSVVTCSLAASITPLICYYFLAPKFVDDCFRDICNEDLSMASNANLGTSGREFLDCVGLQVSQASSSLCLPRSTAILPPFGLFHLLSMALISEITFISEPPEYVEEVFIPSIGGDFCSGSTCQFPFAHDRYGMYLGFMLLGAFLLLLLGFCLVTFFSFPSGISRQVRNYISHLYKSLLFSKELRIETETKKIGEETEPFEEVLKESELVHRIVRELQSPSEQVSHSLELVEEVSGRDTEVEIGEVNVDTNASIRESLPPVIAYKLRKVYPSLGGLPPKVALASLDLHVPKGQVLGLLGQNGAGTSFYCFNLCSTAAQGLTVFLFTVFLFTVFLFTVFLFLLFQEKLPPSRFGLPLTMQLADSLSLPGMMFPPKL
jgi:hypothetical protein